eukprot:TRINITY_DN486_c0_g1_i7.p1 TRINITY_DN486_c0_g1~~TRINITY_DN486_c0_g1_i7.p1  ORF type:complete len:118 (+),score=5.16 TRINITY_DN486_c0_g1_i7:290-643(+)
MHELIMVPQPRVREKITREDDVNDEEDDSARRLYGNDSVDYVILHISTHLTHIDICLLIFISRTTLPLYQLGHFKGNYMIFLIISIVLLEGRRARKDGEIGIKRRVEGEEADSDRNA